MTMAATVGGRERGDTASELGFRQSSAAPSSPMAGQRAIGRSNHGNKAVGPQGECSDEAVGPHVEEERREKKARARPLRNGRLWPRLI